MSVSAVAIFTAIVALCELGELAWKRWGELMAEQQYQYMDLSILAILGQCPVWSMPTDSETHPVCVSFYVPAHLAEQFKRAAASLDRRAARASEEPAPDQEVPLAVVR